MFKLKYPYKLDACYSGLCICILLVTGILTGCASTQKAPAHSFPPCISSSGIEQDIRQEISTWLNTPYRMGGTSKQAGVDCSGLVMVIFKKIFNIDLPRATNKQVEAGRYINREGLCAGDLVFFKLPYKTPHVGIYLSSGKFVHASSSRGVIISDMDNVYWEKTYWTSRRIIY
jgi:cell wall-associated NlpC family hydrolase